jgi:small subunit ribosomal protein S8
MVEIPYSRIKSEIARILKKEGFINDYITEGGGAARMLRLYLKYVREKEPGICGLRRASRPGLRVYASGSEVPSVLNGMGVVILTTSSGVMTDSEARRRRIGGEVLCHVW